MIFSMYTSRMEVGRDSRRCSSSLVLSYRARVVVSLAIDLEVFGNQL